MQIIDWSEVLKKNQHKSCLTLMELGGAYRQMGRYEEAETCFTQALDLAKMIEDPRLQQTAIIWIGNLYYHSGRFYEALEVLQPVDVFSRNYHVQSVMHAMGNFQGRASQSSDALISMAPDESVGIKCSMLALHLESLLWDGRLAEAWGSLKKLFTVLQDKDLQAFPLVYGTALLSIARTYARLGCVDDAKRSATEALTIYESHGIIAGVVRSSVLLASLVESPSDRAIENLLEVERLLDGFYEDPSHHISVKLALGKLFLGLMRIDAAKQEVYTANALLDRYNLIPDRLDALLLSSRCELALQNWEGAISYINQAESLEKEHIKTTNLDFQILLAKSQVLLALGCNSQFKETTDLANERYKSLIAGLPTHIVRTFNMLPHVAQLLKLRQYPDLQR